MIFLIKGYDIRISENLAQAEIDCNCDSKTCATTMVAESTVESFELTRRDFGKPVYVNSWFRCQEWNTHVGGVDRSYHKNGHATDLRPANRDDLDDLEDIAKKYFDVVIRYKHFIHCHNIPDPVELPLSLRFASK